MSDCGECPHPAVPTPPFEELAAAHVTARHVRVIWPPARARCEDCGMRVIRWASYAHVLCGGWVGPPDATTNPPTAVEPSE